MQTKKYYSSFGEDVIVLGIIKRAEWLLRKPILDSPKFYVDIGCFDPVIDSTTFLFYELGWHGILVDPNEKLASRILEHRPRDTFINAAVSDSDQPHDYYIIADFAQGNTISTDFLKDVSKIDRVEMTKNVSRVAGTTLESIMNQANQDVFILNVDAEGVDFKILKAYSWKKKPVFITVEDFDLKTNMVDPRVEALLASQGYSKVANAYLTSIYLLKESEIYSALDTAKDF